MQKAIVKWFDAAKGFGFLIPADGGAEVFVHYSAILGQGVRSLVKGEHVEFSDTVTAKGRQATAVKQGVSHE